MILNRFLHLGDVYLVKILNKGLLIDISDAHAGDIVEVMLLVKLVEDSLNVVLGQSLDTER